MPSGRRLVAGLLAVAALSLAACARDAPDPAAGPAPAAEPRPSPAPSPAPPVAAPTPSPSATPASPPPRPSPRPTTVPSAGPLPPSPSATPPRPPAATPPPATTALPAAWRGVDLERLRTDERVVALTFDAGASDAAADRILAVLDARDVPATFFVTGAFARANPEDVRAMAEAGHPVGNHSDAHRALPDLTDAAIAADLARAESAIAAAAGAPAKPLFRFPFGARTPYDIGVVNDLGYACVRWTVDALGWRGTASGGSAALVADRVAAAARPGAIVLLHVGANPDDGSTLDADALPAIIDRLRAEGYGFVDLDGVGR